jgi:hypothetical protein
MTKEGARTVGISGRIDQRNRARGQALFPRLKIYTLRLCKPQIELGIEIPKPLRERTRCVLLKPSDPLARMSKGRECCLELLEWVVFSLRREKEVPLANTTPGPSPKTGMNMEETIPVGSLSYSFEAGGRDFERMGGGGNNSPPHPNQKRYAERRV